MRHVLPALCLAVLAACETPDPAFAACGADGFQAAVGGSIGAISMPTGQPTRIIHPGDLVTQDYRPERINFDVDEAGTITRVWCG